LRLTFGHLPVVPLRRRSAAAACTHLYACTELLSRCRVWGRYLVMKLEVMDALCCAMNRIAVPFVPLVV
jgi:hypothetical protein